MPCLLPKRKQNNQKCGITQRPVEDTCLDLGGLCAKFTLTLAPSQSQGYLVSPQDLQGPEFSHPAMTKKKKGAAVGDEQRNTTKSLEVSL